MLHYNLSSHSVSLGERVRIMGFGFLQLAATLTFLVVSCASQAKPLVLSSLKPLTLIAQEITGSNADVDTLLPASASHHDYPLKVSDHARLQKADVFLWIGPELESFLQKPVANLPRTKILTAYDLPGLYWPVEEGGGASHGDHDHHAKDPHIWLDPRNAVIVAQALTQKLVQVDGANAGKYRANLQIFVEKMQQLDRRLQASLKPVANVGFAVYHEGFAHFVSHYGLRQLDYVAFTPEQKPGAKHMHQLRERLAKEGKCLFLEPYNNMQSTRDLAQELQLRLGTLDALGAQDVTTYTQLLEQMAAAFSACLTNRRN
ncbi:zinc ABC transporter substrate-binding protein [Cellvibrio zantedeschiae]|uniref:High-affinity zinc uptake system protein ZnuA n=1 Tax=Cellvibrio zantedeschiae TaxID=1237077 RepID=A0ABQ3BA81_9GAMM|nr:zinc ABC transporter substrate-binding protein [Cellvibrio zantedeschiae]GGY85824.1 zinc ABC transporter substrate-binding protein [Cellvibrio zantedeschiae]